MASQLPQALRLTLAYRDGIVRIVGSERIAMIVPAAVGSPPTPGQTGYWIAVRDASGVVVYHRPLHAPVRIDVESFSPDPRQSLARAPIAVAEGRFTVLIADDPSAQTFELHGPADPRRAAEPAIELLRTDVDALRRMAASSPQPPAIDPLSPQPPAIDPASPPSDAGNTPQGGGHER
jgi:hypothetical protein